MATMRGGNSAALPGTASTNRVSANRGAPWLSANPSAMLTWSASQPSATAYSGRRRRRDARIAHWKLSAPAIGGPSTAHPNHGPDAATPTNAPTLPVSSTGLSRPLSSSMCSRSSSSSMSQLRAAGSCAARASSAPDGGGSSGPGVTPRAAIDSWSARRREACVRASSGLPVASTRTASRPARLAS